MILTTLDWESAYGKHPVTGENITLSQMTTEEYVRHPLFKAHGLGVKIESEPSFYVYGDDLLYFLRSHPWSKTYAICHHTHFDGAIFSWKCGISPAMWACTLSMFRALYPWESHSLASMARVLGIGEKGTELVHFNGKWQLTPQEQQVVGGYCRNDIDITHDAFQIMKHRFPVSELRLIDLTIRLFTEPVLEVDRPVLVEEFKREKRYKRELIKQCVSDKTVLASNDKFAALLVELGVDPPKKISPAKIKDGRVNLDKVGLPPHGMLPDWTGLGKRITEMARLKHWTNEEIAEKRALLKEKKENYPWAYAFGKNDEKFKMLLDHEDPKVRAVVEARFGVKSTIKETRSKRFYKIGKRGAFPVYHNYYGAKCVTGDVEVLTPKGWVRIDEWDGGLIIQGNEKQELTFLPAEKFEGGAEKNWVEVDAPHFEGAFTRGHTMPYLAQQTFNWRTVKAAAFSDNTYRAVPTSGVLKTGGWLTPEQMRVVVMVQADGYFEENTASDRACFVTVKKSRKIERAREVLTAAGIVFSEHKYASMPGYVRFKIRYTDYPAWFGPSFKQFGSWLLDSTPGAREAFITELVHWDGYTHNNAEHYTSVSKTNAEWAVTLAHLTGRGGSIITKKASGRRRECYTVCIRQRAYTLVRREHITNISNERPTYCAITKTGFWLARSKGKIFLTGNTGRDSGGDKQNTTNLNRVDPKDPTSGALRRSLVAPHGHLIVVRDLGQIEARKLAYWAGQEDLLDLFRAGGDPYNRQASLIFGYEVDRKSEEHFIEGLVGKSSTLGNGYGMGWGKFQESLRVGFMGAPPVIFGEDVMHKVGADLDVFCMSRSYKKEFDTLKEEALAMKPLNVTEHNHLVHCATVKAIVDGYRQSNPAITALWKEAGQALNIIAQGGEVELGMRGLIKTCAEGLLLPNGMKIYYHHLKQGKDGSWRYLANRRKNEYSYIYGGKVTENCIAAGTEVLTDTGWIKIEDLKQNQKVHDGVDFVNHGGIVYKKKQTCITVDGVHMTPDHEVLTDGGWKKAEAALAQSRLFRPGVWTFNGYSSGPLERKETILGVPLSMRSDRDKSWVRRNERSKTWRDPELWLSYEDFTPEEKLHSWNVEASSICCVAVNDGSVQTSFPPSMEKLRRAWDKGLQALAGWVRKFLGRYGANVPTRAPAGATGQRRKLRTNELLLGYSFAAKQQQARQCSDSYSQRNDDSIAGVASFRYRKNDNSLQNIGWMAGRGTAAKARCTEQVVYDILNCGPRNRFVVRGLEGPFIVHNCTQALARIVMTDQQLKINQHLQRWKKQDPKKIYKIVTSTYDEIVTVIPEYKAAETLQMMGEEMAKAPSWCPDLPLKSSGGYGKSYGDCEK